MKDLISKSAALDNAWQAVLLGENDNAHHLNLAYTIYETADEEGREKTDSYLKKWYEKYPENPIAEQCFKSFYYDENFDTSNRKYVEELFDVFASDFDAVLKDLDYDSPNIIARYLKEYFNKNNSKILSFLDLGCGSGLCGKHLKKIFKKRKKRSKISPRSIGSKGLIYLCLFIISDANIFRLNR